MSDTIVTLTVNGPPDKDGKPTRRTERLTAVMPDFSTIEELTIASTTVDKRGVRRPRIAAAMIALCCPDITRMLRRAKVTYEAHEFDALAFGRAAYNWMHDQGIPGAEIVAAFIPLQIALIAAGYPRTDEVDEAAGKSEESAGPATA